MTAQKQCLPSFATIISVLSIVFYCAGFLRVELEINEQKRRINALESKLPSGDPSLIKLVKNAPGKFALSLVKHNIRKYKFLTCRKS